MDLLSIFIIAVGLAMDSFAVCIGKGMYQKRFWGWRSFKIALVFALFQGLMPLFGFLLGLGFSDWIRQFDHWVAFGILSILGGRMIIESFYPERPSDETLHCCVDCEKIAWRNVISLSFATSIDAMATGLIFVPYSSMMPSAVLIIAAVTLFFTFGGIWLGVCLGRKIPFKVEIIGGLMLIGIGLKILIEHLTSGC